MGYGLILRRDRPGAVDQRHPRDHPGHLVLGSAFSWGDIVAYTVGIALVAPLDAWWFGRGGTKSANPSATPKPPTA